jgi:hypothetical protein
MRDLFLLLPTSHPLPVTTLVSDNTTILGTMGDDTTKDGKTLLGTSGPKDEDNTKRLIEAILKKLDVLETVGTRLDRLEAGQQDLLRMRAPDLLHLRKEGPMGSTRFHKLDFPTFDGGGDPLPFLNRFRGQRTLEEERVWLAAFHLQGSAQQWYMRLERDEGTPGWRRFCELLDLRFGPPLRANPLGELAACRRTGSVAEYQERFLALLTRAGPLTEDQQIQLFVAGLQEPLSIDIQLQGPHSLETAMSLACSYERREQLAAPATQTFRSARPSPGRRILSASPGQHALPAPPAQLALPAPCSSTRQSPPPHPPSSSPGTVMVAGRTVRRLTPAEVDERRRNGQCFNCDEKYVRSHNRVCAKLFSLEIHDNDDDLELEDPAEQPRISLIAIAGVRSRDTMQVLVRFGAVTVTALLDSGSNPQLCVSFGGGAMRSLFHPPHQHQRHCGERRQGASDGCVLRRTVLHRRRGILGGFLCPSARWLRPGTRH